MPTDPSSIPEYVLSAAAVAIFVSPLRGNADAQLAEAIAAALDALMDDKPTIVAADRAWSADDDLAASIKPSDVLAAVLERSTDAH